ncbi:DUF2947 family protein [Chryseobacterium sp. 2VB]|uniref:DUF2947 family protein n=1 Tax=Chryseobacterium sp. 2VB TaxID=2502204 RepID=UPI0010F74984|nr:DUF2947 family protein [Chryseobacterium sp. 2VB]
MSETIITKTFYSEYFDEAIEDIYLLEKETASKLWELKIDSKSNNFFKLSNDNIIILNSKNIGDWRNYYDKDDILGLQSFLNLNIKWKSDNIVLFCINKETIIKTNYGIFLNNIFNFLELYDDCPILLNENGECMYFAPLGNIFHSLYKI